jgi:hypothetical protein
MTRISTIQLNRPVPTLLAAAAVAAGTAVARLADTVVLVNP